MSLFKAYDVRGVYPDEINENIAKKIAKAFIKKTKAKKIILGYDQRPHSPSLRKAVVEGLLESGAEITDIGLATSPMFNFAVIHLKADAGMMITASHNPSKYNGIKFSLKDAVPFGDQEIQELRQLVEKNEFEKSGPGEIIEKNIFEDYKKKVLTFNKIKKPLKVVIDIGNGMCGLTIPKIFKELPIQTTYLYQKIDLNFPNHEANPLKLETLKDLQAEVIKQKADLGLAFDGDGDRAGFVDEKGQVVPMDFVTALIADSLPGKKIIYDIRSTKIIKEIVEKNKGQALPGRVGHYFMKKLMREKDAVFGGEVSGHYYFKEVAYTDSAVLAAMEVMDIISQSTETFSEIMKKYQKYFKINETNFEVRDKDKKIQEIQEHYKDGKTNLLDGVTIEFPDWWFNLRKSNTEPFIRLNLEANTQELMEQKLKELSELIKQ